MYIPKSNKFTDRAEIVEFMRRFSFATIITSTNNFPIATHLPFVVTYENDNITLTSHFAKANPQWKQLEDTKVLIIFSEPHAYISPKNYDSEQNVPTWDYISVHAYGDGKIISTTNEVIQVLEKTIDNYEMSYKQQWNNLPEEYILNLTKGIVAFNITVTDLEAKKKLSQTKSKNEQQKIVDSLQKSEHTSEQLIAHYMKQNQ